MTTNSNQGFIIQFIGNIIQNSIHEAFLNVNNEAVDFFTNPDQYLIDFFNYLKNIIVSAIQSKLDVIVSKQMGIFKTTHPNLSPDELQKILLTHSIFFSVIFQIIISSIDGNINFLDLSEEELIIQIENIIQNELQQYQLSISIEEFIQIVLELLETNLIHDLTNYFILTIPNAIIKVLLSFFPLINTPTVVFNILENQLPGLFNIVTNLTIKGAEILVKINKKQQIINKYNDQTGGKHKMTSSGKLNKKINKYSKKFYINRIHKTLKNFYKR
jgi:hypothetical protein